MPRIDLTGQTFGRLTVLKEAKAKVYDNGKRYRRWLCSCSCGGEKLTAQISLTRGNTKSCGCIQKESTSAASTTHGLHSDSHYMRWHGMVRRCHTPKASNYERYGGRGITVCSEWRHEPTAFIEWATPRFEEGLTLERIDNEAGYSPENCTFVTPAQQQQNTRRVNSR